MFKKLLDSPFWEWVGLGFALIGIVFGLSVTLILTARAIIEIYKAAMS